MAEYASPARASLEHDPVQWIADRRVTMVDPMR